MATQTVIGSGPLSVTGGFFQLRAGATNALVASAAATETASGSTIYTAAFTDQPAAEYRLVFVDGSSVVRYVQWVTLVLETSTYIGYETPRVTSASGTIYPVVERSPADTKPLTFQWPVTGATITGTVSKDNAAYVAVTGGRAFLETDASGVHWYTLAFNAADRPTAEGTARYVFTDGTYTRTISMRIAVNSFKTQMTESYAADGVAPTPEQALFMIQQSQNEAAISGTTKTVKKIDKTTTAATFTLDDADDPSSVTRAT